LMLPRIVWRIPASEPFLEPEDSGGAKGMRLHQFNREGWATKYLHVLSWINSCFLFPWLFQNFWQCFIVDCSVSLASTVLYMGHGHRQWAFTQTEIWTMTWTQTWRWTWTRTQTHTPTQT
jgi:hypothetical protein